MLVRKLLGAAVVAAAVLALQAGATPAADPEAHAPAGRAVLPIPSSIEAEHVALHAELSQLLELGGGTAKAAGKVADALHAHFEKEEKYALPPLALLPVLARGETPAEAHAAVELTHMLRAELPQMLREHAAIVAALNGLVEAAKAEGKPEAERFAAALQLHARNEEEILYPASLLVGRFLEQAKP